MSLKGNLATMGLEDLLQWLAVGKKTGVLAIRGAAYMKTIAFEDGRITSASSTDPKEYLGQFLLAYNRINEAQLREALAAQEDENELLGRILVNRHFVTENEIRRIIQLKTEESLYDCFLWASGEFEFMEGQRPDPRTVLLNLDVTGIVLEGARRRDEWQRIREALKGGDAIVVADSEAIAEQLPLAAEDAELLAHVDGLKSVDHLVLELRSTEFKVSRHIYDLIERGLVRVSVQGGAKVKAEDPLQKARALLDRKRLAEAQEEIRRVLQGQPQDPVANRMMKEVQNLQQAADKPLNLEQIPELAVDLMELTHVDLSPGEAFMATRVTGMHSFRDLMAVAPFNEDECKAIFASLLKRGILRTEKPAAEGGRASLH
ncbi:MAG: DUF4388 domain-containing protein [Acidobacteria bacterium]|nr:DUF4388 domain-containing protein [Acidobacteriota bacterium]